ncbi:MAG TPA: hypothetical protein VKQ30_02805, partial [Ktedonobacterales bacterium]|nr:hypothetical protein [Ktedonobacterales bacterium]
MHDVRKMALPMAGKVVLITGGTGVSVKPPRTRRTDRGRHPCRVGLSSSRRVRRRPRRRPAAGRAGQQCRRVLGERAHPAVGGRVRTFAQNYLAPFLLTNLLTNLLLDRLTASAPARVVTVASGA